MLFFLKITSSIIKLSKFLLFSLKKITIFNLCFLMIITSCTDQKKTNDNYEPEILPNQAIFEKPIDLSIKNILIYPNQFDKNSVSLFS